jgi:hypothetical protein
VLILCYSDPTKALKHIDRHTIVDRMVGGFPPLQMCYLSMYYTKTLEIIYYPPIECSEYNFTSYYVNVI